jgi:hypothetical protein
MIKARAVRWMGYIACMGRCNMHIEILSEQFHGRESLEDLGIGGPWRSNM